MSHWLRSIAVCALAACKSAPVETWSPPEGADLAYCFRLHTGEELAVDVDAWVPGASDGATELALDAGWGGTDPEARDIAALTVRSEQGVALAVEREGASRWLVHHAPGARLRVSYRIEPNAHQADASPNVHYRPILNAGLFHLIGDVGLVRPLQLGDETPVHVALTWRGFDAAGWSVASSFGPGAQERVLALRSGELFHALFIAGKLRLYQRDIGGRPLTLAIDGEWDFADEVFVDLTTQIVQAERAFFGEFDTPHQLITLIPVGVRDPGSTSIGGTALTQAFALFTLPGTSLSPGSEQRRAMARLLAHELFHAWNGVAIRPDGPEELAYWFTEGFTDFYARRLLRRCGVFDVDDYVADINHSLTECFTSPVRNEPNARIAVDFWKDRDVQTLPYRRGDAVAIVVDAAIRARSAGARSLDDVMRGLARGAREGAARLDTDGLIALFARETDAATAAAIRRVIVDGALPVLDAATFEPCLALRVEPLGPFDLGFDFERSRAQRIVHGARQGSRAWEVGLRDGQELAGWSITLGDPRRRVELEIQDVLGTRRISYLPQGDPVAVPHFEPRSLGSDRDCDRL